MPLISIRWWYWIESSRIHEPVRESYLSTDYIDRVFPDETMLTDTEQRENAWEHKKRQAQRVRQAFKGKSALHYMCWYAWKAEGIEQDKIAELYDIAVVTVKRMIADIKENAPG